MYENKISARQLRRMIFIETFGAGALSIPAFACYKEQNGFWRLIFYGVFLAGTIAFFIIFSGKISEENFENTIDCAGGSAPAGCDMAGLHEQYPYREIRVHR